jgi:peptide-methionine (S)-S-oxide reductase
MGNKTEVATLAGGCFWCLEAVFDDLNGVLSVESGYSGGKTPNPTYEAVCSGTTGHAEVVQVTFDPSIISYADLLRIFFSIHDPTTINRQGADTGTQYRSAIFIIRRTKPVLNKSCVKLLTKNMERPDRNRTRRMIHFIWRSITRNTLPGTRSQGYCRW